MIELPAYEGEGVVVTSGNRVVPGRYTMHRDAIESSRENCKEAKHPGNRAGRRDAQPGAIAPLPAGRGVGVR